MTGTEELLSMLDSQLGARFGPCPLHDLDDHRRREWWTVADLFTVMNPDLGRRSDGTKTTEQNREEARLRGALARLLKDGLVEKREGQRCCCPRDIESVNDDQLRGRTDPELDDDSQSRSDIAYRLTAAGVSAVARQRPAGPYF